MKVYLEYLAVERTVTSSTQNQALNALVFFFEQVLDHEIGTIGEFTRARTPVHVPVVLSKNEVLRLLNAFVNDLIALWKRIAFKGVPQAESKRYRFFPGADHSERR